MPIRLPHTHIQHTLRRAYTLWVQNMHRRQLGVTGYRAPVKTRFVCPRYHWFRRAQSNVLSIRASRVGSGQTDL